MYVQRRTFTHDLSHRRRRKGLSKSTGRLFKKAVSKSSKGEAPTQQEGLRQINGITSSLAIAGIARSSYYK